MKLADKKEHEVEELWRVVEGREPNVYNTRDGLLRSLAWGKDSASWYALSSLIEIVRRLEDRVTELEKERNDWMLRE